MRNLLIGCALLLAGSLTAVDGVREFVYPDVKIIAVQDRPAKFPKSLFFAAAKSDFTPGAEFYDASVSVFLIAGANGIALVDTGYGEAAGGQLMRKLAELKIDPARIGDVFITHIHPDHVGGLARGGAAAFPRATVHIAREEYEAWKKDAGRARLEQSLRVCPPEKLHLFEFDRELRGAFGSLIPRRAAGHTPGHTVFEKIVPPRTPSGAKESVFFVGDILHALGLQVGHYEFCARFDQDPALAVKTRRDAFLRYKGAWFGAHFPFPGKVGIRRDGDRFTVAADK